MNREQINTGTAELKSCVADLMSTVDSISGKFTAATDAGFLTGTLKTISQQTSSIGSSISSIQNTINNKTNEMFEIDRKGAEKFNDIEICTDFYANNDTDQNEYNKVLIDKTDDKSVNEGEVTDSVDVHGDETTVKGVGLVDITGEAGKEHDDQKTGVVAEGIGNINVATDKGVTVDADSNVANRAIGNIKKDEAGQARESGNAEVVNANIANINNGVTADADGNIGVSTGKETLGSVSSTGTGSTVTDTSVTNSTPNVPLSTAAYSSTGDEKKDAKQSSIGTGVAAGLVGAAGLAGLVGASREGRNKNEDDEAGLNAAVEAQAVAEEAAEENKDDTNHLNG